MNIICLAKPSVKIVSNKISPKLPPIKQLICQPEKYQMYVARKAWHQFADDLYIQCMENTLYYNKFIEIILQQEGLK